MSSPGGELELEPPSKKRPIDEVDARYEFNAPRFVDLNMEREMQLQIDENGIDSPWFKNPHPLHEPVVPLDPPQPLYIPSPGPEERETSPEPEPKRRKISDSGGSEAGLDAADAVHPGNAEPFPEETLEEGFSTPKKASPVATTAAKPKNAQEVQEATTPRAPKTPSRLGTPGRVRVTTPAKKIGTPGRAIVKTPSKALASPAPKTPGRIGRTTGISGTPGRVVRAMSSTGLLNTPKTPKTPRTPKPSTPFSTTPSMKTPEMTDDFTDILRKYAARPDADADTDTLYGSPKPTVNLVEKKKTPMGITAAFRSPARGISRPSPALKMSAKKEASNRSVTTRGGQAGNETPKKAGGALRVMYQAGEERDDTDEGEKIQDDDDIDDELKDLIAHHNKKVKDEAKESEELERLIQEHNKKIKPVTVTAPVAFTAADKSKSTRSLLSSTGVGGATAKSVTRREVAATGNVTTTKRAGAITSTRGKAAVGKENNKSSRGDDDDMKEIQALLNQHNKKFKKPAYEPRSHSVRDIKQWEKSSGKSYYGLSVEERESVNQQIHALKMKAH